MRSHDIRQQGGDGASQYWTALYSDPVDGGLCPRDGGKKFVSGQDNEFVRAGAEQSRRRTFVSLLRRRSVGVCLQKKEYQYQIRLEG
jgi:hypothetical protein